MKIFEFGGVVRPTGEGERVDWSVTQGDAIETMRQLADGSVDACITDPPYGTTACAWDSPIPFAPMWAQLKRVVKKNGAIVLFGSQPFTSALVMSNPEMFKYELIWEKDHGTNFLNAPYQPLKVHEVILVFSQSASSHSPRGVMNYKPQMEEGMPYPIRRGVGGRYEFHAMPPVLSGGQNEGVRHPRSVVNFTTEKKPTHPTEKPVELMRYLVRTYTNAGDTVLDFTCGSGSTGVGCVIEGRNFIGIDSDAGYCEIARARIQRAQGIAVDIPRPVREHKELPLFANGV